MDKSQSRPAISANPPEKRHAVDEARSDQSVRKTPAELELSSFFGLPDLRLILWGVALGVIITWFALMLIVPLMSNDLPMATPWQRLQDLFLTRPTTALLLLGVAVAFVLPNFAWLYVLFVWLRVLWRRSRVPQA
jgi:hypothetical protein